MSVVDARLAGLCLRCCETCDSHPTYSVSVSTEKQEVRAFTPSSKWQLCISMSQQVRLSKVAIHFQFTAADGWNGTHLKIMFTLSDPDAKCARSGLVVYWFLFLPSLTHF